MNAKRIIITIIATFAVVWVTDFLLHSLVLKADYEATQQLWRPEDQMKGFMKWIMLGELMVAAGMSVLWLRGFAGDATPLSALGFGAFAGLIGSAYAPVFYAVMPLPSLLCLKWVIFGVLQSILVALVLFAATRSGKSEPAA